MVVKRLEGIVLWGLIFSLSKGIVLWGLTFSVSRTHYATRSAKRKSIASTNLVAENSFRPSKLDFRVNEDGNALSVVQSVSASRTRYVTRSGKINCFDPFGGRKNFEAKQAGF